MPNFYGAISLTGGGTGALDAIDGSLLVDGDGAVVITSSHVYFYHLNATHGGSESSPEVIVMDNNAGDKRWVLGEVHSTREVGFSSRCSVYRNTMQSIPTTAWTKVQFNAKSYDIDNEFDSISDYEFTVAVTGYYTIVVSLYYMSVVSGKLIYCKVQKNGLGGTTLVYATTIVGGTESVSVTKDVYLEEGDTIQVYAYHNDTVNRNLSGQAFGTYLDIHRFA